MKPVPIHGSVRASGLLLAFVLILCPGCTTALLWDWAGEQETAGQLIGVVPDQGGDVVLYDFSETAEYRGGRVGIRIAQDWRALPLRALASSPMGNALALTQPLVLTGGRLPLSSRSRPLRLIDYRETIGRQDVSFEPGERPYGFVRLINDREEIIHELYGYDSQRRQWVQLASVNLGEYRADSGRLATGILLTPVTMVFDFAIFAALVYAAGSGGGSYSSFDFPTGGSYTSAAVHFAVRDRYWWSLMAAPVPFR